jgi:hypothetical protein
MKATVIALKDLGVNCWCPTRFIQKGSTCPRVYS